MSNLLSGKTAIVTGGSRGIGTAIVQEFAKAGANVVFTYHSSADAALAIQKELTDGGHSAVAVKSDAGKLADAEALVKLTTEKFGGVDILVNNAGITRDTLLMRMSEDQWDQVISTNMKSVFNLTKQVIRPMMKKRAGSIINISSIVGVSGNAGQSNYAASKAGVIGFTKSIAIELGSRSIRCNAVAPGFIQTDMTSALTDDVKDKYIQNIPLKRLGEPNDIAQACLFLASDMSQYISGQVLNVCGAMNT